MSLPPPVLRVSGKLKRPPVGSRDKEERSSGPDPGDLEIEPSNASATTKLILLEVKESSKAYPPLKSVAEDLWFVLDNCEV